MIFISPPYVAAKVYAVRAADSSAETSFDRAAVSYRAVCFFLAGEAIQVHSINTNAVEQGQLPLTRTPRQADVTLEVIMRRRDLLSAINLCIDVSGLEDKELYIPLGIDAGHWSNIRKGKPATHFPTNKLNQLMAMCGNQIPLIWLAHSNGFGLHMLESEAERQLRGERERADKAEEKYRVLAEVLQGKAA